MTDTLPKPVDDVTAIYARRFCGQADYRDRVWQAILDGFLQDFIPSDARVLDLGAGSGEFIRNVNAAEKFALDANPDLPFKVNKDTQSLVQLSAEPWSVAPDSLDAVFTSNFFEHLPHKPALMGTLRRAVCALKPGGVMLCLGPNIRYLAGAYWDFIDHHLPLTHHSLREALELAGLKVEYCLPRFLPYTMSQGWQPPVWCLKAYLRTPWLWPVLGKQFFIVARKP